MDGTKDREEEPVPPAGPHAEPDLMDPEKTPGAGTLPPVDGEADEEGGNMQPSS